MLKSLLLSFVIAAGGAEELPNPPETSEPLPEHYCWYNHCKIA